MINSALTNMMPFPELASPASPAPAQPATGGGAFSEALAGAQGLQERMQSQEGARARGEAPGTHRTPAVVRPHLDGQQDVQQEGVDDVDVTGVAGEAGADRSWAAPDTTLQRPVREPDPTTQVSRCEPHAEAEGPVTLDDLAAVGDAVACGEPDLGDVDDVAVADVTIAADAVLIPVVALPAIGSQAIDAAVRLAIETAPAADVTSASIPVAGAPVLPDSALGTSPATPASDVPSTVRAQPSPSQPVQRVASDASTSETSPAAVDAGAVEMTFAAGATRSASDTARVVGAAVAASPIVPEAAHTPGLVDPAAAAALMTGNAPVVTVPTAAAPAAQLTQLEDAGSMSVDSAVVELPMVMTTPGQLASVAGRGKEDAGSGDEAGPTRLVSSTPILTSGPAAPAPGAVQTAPTTTSDTEVAQPRQGALVAVPEVASEVEPEVATTSDAAVRPVVTGVVPRPATVDEVETVSALPSVPPSVQAQVAATPQVQQAQAAAVAADAPDTSVDSTGPVAQPVDGGDGPTRSEPSGSTDGRSDASAFNGGREQRPADATDSEPGRPAQPAQAAVVVAGAGQAAPGSRSESASVRDGAQPASKAEPLQPTPVAAGLGATRGEQALASARLREAAAGLGRDLQARVDHIARQLATRLRLSQAAGGSQVQLSLKPRELGDVTVQMQVRDGVVAASVLVDRADTLRTLQTNIDALKRSLEQQGLAIGEFSVDVRGEAGAGGANARAAAELRGASRRSSSDQAAQAAASIGTLPGLTGSRMVELDEIHDGDVSVLA